MDLRNREKAQIISFADFTQHNLYLYHENEIYVQKSTMSKIIIFFCISYDSFYDILTVCCSVVFLFQRE